MSWHSMSGRKTSLWSAEDGRDKGKMFLLTEMSAMQGEDWAMRAILALMQANVDLPDGALELGMAGLAEIGLKKLAQISPIILKGLLAELMAQVQYVPDASKTHVRRPLLDDPEDIEEIQTRVKLKWQVLKLHVDFSEAVEPLISKVKGAMAGKPERVTRMSRK
jgi:hypothetical protein